MYTKDTLIRRCRWSGRISSEHSLAKPCTLWSNNSFAQKLHYGHFMPSFILWIVKNAHLYPRLSGSISALTVRSVSAAVKLVHCSGKTSTVIWKSTTQNLSKLPEKGNPNRAVKNKNAVVWYVDLLTSITTPVWQSDAKCLHVFTSPGSFSLCYTVLCGSARRVCMWATFNIQDNHRIAHDATGDKSLTTSQISILKHYDQRAHMAIMLSIMTGCNIMLSII